MASAGMPSPPATGDPYIDSCFHFELDDRPEPRDWRRMEELAQIPRLAAAGSVQDALTIVEAELEGNPDFDFLYVWRGYLQGRLGLRQDQRATYLEGLRKARSKISLCDHLGMWAFESDDLAQAVQWWIRSCVLQLGQGRTEVVQPFLRLAYLAEGLGLKACRSALLDQVDRIQHVRLNAEGEKACWRLAVDQGDDSVRRAVSLLCESYLWQAPAAADETLQPLGETVSPTGFDRTFARHLDRIRSQSPELEAFLDRHFAADWVADLAQVAEREMRQTLSDGDEHGTALSRPPVYYQISTLQGDLSQARDWFLRRYGGYTKALEGMWNSTGYRTSGCSVLCHVIYLCTSEQIWAHLAICPLGESAPIDQWVMPIEFLSPAERATLDL
jgi:hypothetical protein